MQVSLKQLDAHIKQTLLPIYLISGDEPLFIQEARESLLLAAKAKGFSEKEICHIEPGFRTETLIGLLQNQSLFSDKKIIDIRNPNAKFDSALISFFQEYVLHPYDDRIIIISTEKLTPASQKTPWFEAIKKHGGYLPVWPIQSAEFASWIMERAKKYQLRFPIAVAQYLAHFSEGNLLSAQQAIEKLQLLYPDAEISREQLITVLSDHARFTIFDLSDALARGHTKKIIRIMNRLEQMGEEPTLVLWSICRQLRENSNSSKVKKALQQAAHVDEIIKGAKTGDVWQALLELCL